MTNLLKPALLGLASLAVTSLGISIQDSMSEGSTNLAQTKVTYLDDDMDYTQMRFERIADELENILAQVKEADYAQLDDAIGEYFQYEPETIFAYP